jgi:hypothetical protein
VRTTGGGAIRPRRDSTDLRRDGIMYIASFDDIRTDASIPLADLPGRTSAPQALALAERRLVKLAMMIEPSERRVMEWWTATPIEELGGLSASELVARGLETPLEKFLLAIIFGDRD